jgi:hypothetical protein
MQENLFLPLECKETHRHCFSLVLTKMEGILNLKREALHSTVLHNQTTAHEFPLSVGPVTVLPASPSQEQDRWMFAVMLLRF